MPCTASRYIRKMRGGSQAHLLEADDNNLYVVKFQNNPQHRRVLVNELVSASFLEYLQIWTARAELVRITRDFLIENPEVYIQLGGRRVPVQPGWHFGSQYPGVSGTEPVYDFLPDPLLRSVANLEGFRAILVFDKWMGNTDSRQCVFFRAQVKEWSGEVRTAFVAVMIDHGFVFNGSAWQFTVSPGHGLYPRNKAYEQVHSLDDFRPWLDLVVHFPEEEVARALRRIPPEWFDDDYDEFVQLLGRLLRRTRRVPDLITDACRAPAKPFPNWGSAPG